jgi:hypothetical protein
MKFVDYNSPEKAILKNVFKSISDMDMWICNIIEEYIYETVEEENILYKYKYTLRYDKKEGEYKEWYVKNGQLAEQCYYKEDKKEVRGLIYISQIKFIAFFMISSCWTNLLNSSASY